jgi:ATP-dependent helicase YprA (DUF1998 family)
VTEDSYSLRNISRELPAKLAQYLEAQYHIWDEQLVKERRRLLDQPGIIFQPPYIEATPNYKAGAHYSQIALPQEVTELLISASKKVGDSATGIPLIPYAHQSTALEAFFRDGKELVISTGTGSGKTESFLMPIVGSLAVERAKRPSSYDTAGVRALLLYPMNALVNDQISRLRRLLGSVQVSSRLVRPDGTAARFGMYISRTPYPGPATAAKNNEVKKWIDRFFAQYTNQRDRLAREGKWPSKDLVAFRNAPTITAASDAELLTRQEMQTRAPDLLVTNYSMLEYMLLRPVDAPIFDQTERWLAKDELNQLIVVLDEAHMYQGAQGTEVALLLRRLVSRLRVKRDKIRFILTSASLAEGSGAEAKIRDFARKLTGATGDGSSFSIVPAQLDKPAPEGLPTTTEADALAKLDLAALRGFEGDRNSSIEAARTLFTALGKDLKEAPRTIGELRDRVYSLLSETRSYKQLGSVVMGKPTAYEKLATEVFGANPNRSAALDALLALAAFAQRAADEKILLPSRAHMLFRGLEGVFACTNAMCPDRVNVDATSVLGRLYSQSRLHCSCGARVYELLTHRDCGAAYLRGYFRPDNDLFLLHEPSTGLVDRTKTLIEVHLLVEHRRDQVGGSSDVWLHTATGRLERLRPSDTNGYLEMRQSGAQPRFIAGRYVNTFDGKCPVCRGRWNDPTRPKIMDLVTKGEDPFAHLVATQVRLQPANILPTRHSPNGGRKSLLFSDGRQKAARLARDVPRILERDAFRQAILLAAHNLRVVKPEARLNDSWMYVAFVAASASLNLRFFDGTDFKTFLRDQDEFLRVHNGDLRSALEDQWEPPAPARFRVEMMRAVGSRYYSLSALGLGYVAPRKTKEREVVESLSKHGFSPADTVALSVLWIQDMLKDMALYSPDQAGLTVRRLAGDGYVNQIGALSGFTRDQKKLLKQVGGADLVEGELRKSLASQVGSSNHFTLNEGSLQLIPALDQAWYRCAACTFLSPVTWRDACAACGDQRVVTVPVGGDVYLRARKDFWRLPVERVLRGQEHPFTLSIEEHTAQLGYRDVEDVESTTESFERRFRDILIDNEDSIDVLSCTTTMEVGIDIGSLIAVGLRNMPPSRHNYQQRAGRAGRRGSAVSTVITYAQNNPHDAHLFANPSELISGAPSLRGLDVDNAALVERHAFAEMLQEFFKETKHNLSDASVFATLGKTRPFFTDSGTGTLIEFVDWLADEKAGRETLVRIDAWLPKGAGISAAECARRLLSRLKELTDVGSGPLQKDEEDLIEFFFAHSVLPAYAFPRDLIALEIQADPVLGTTLERPQQGAGVALSEYAPGRTVVVNKNTYRVGAVTSSSIADLRNRAASMFRQPKQYLQCPECLYTEEPGARPSKSPCPTCATALDAITVVQPQIVWPQNRAPVDELDDDQTMTDTTLAQLPVPSSDLAFQSQEAFGANSVRKFGRRVSLIVVNRGQVIDGVPSGFEVCDQCGHVPLNGNPFTVHRRHYAPPRGQRDSNCTGSARHVYLGYEFRTDVFLLYASLHAPFVCNLADVQGQPALRAACMSLANALALTAASVLGIDQRELQSGFRIRRNEIGNALVEIYLYDTLTGGAGYSKLVGENVAEIFKKALSDLDSCDCDSSCTKCLRTYQNRLSHSVLDRHLASQLANHLRDGVVPAIAAPALQRKILRPVAQMLELEGWSLRESKAAAFDVFKGDLRVTLAARPALRASESDPEGWNNVIVLSEYEVRKDLPSCLLKFP